jgi:hypothetical protein
MWAMTRLPRPFASLALALFGGLAVLTVGCSGPNPYQAAESANSVDTSTGTDTADTNTADTAGNVFIPEDQNISSCVGTLERPDCGSKSKGGWRMYLTFAVLIAGLSFVGWRIVKGVRSNGAATNGAAANGAAANDTAVSGPVDEPPKVAPPTS